MKEFLIYGSIDSWSAGRFIEGINEALEKEPNAEIVVRVNTPGGEVDYGWGAVAKFSELTNKKKVQVDGKAHSMGLYYCCYTEDVNALDVSDFLLHRAAYPSWIESDPNYFTPERKSSLERMNKKLRAAFEAKVDVPLFEKLTSAKLDDVYSMDSRVDVRFTAQVAKKIGLIKSFTTITPQKKAEIEALMFEITALNNGFEIAAKTENKKTENKKIMTIEQLTSEQPDLVKQIAANAIKAERDRVKSYLVFRKVDPESVDKGIESGEPLSEAQRSEFMLKSVSGEALDKLKKNSAKPTATEEPELDEEKKAEAEAKKKSEEFFAEVHEHLGMKKA